MGTALPSRPAQALNLTRPDAVFALHRAYVEAGARLIVTNTIAAFDDEAACEAGVRLARKAAEHDVIVAGSLPAVPGRTPQSCQRQVRALAAADLLLVETVRSLAALRETVQAIRAVATIPIACTVSFDEDGRLEGRRAGDVAHDLSELGLAAFGYGCGFGPEQALLVMVEMRDAVPNAILIAKPSAGVRMTASPAALGRWAKAAVASGIQVIGACCGSTPAHIRAISEALIQ